jgi:hypothetical protein
VTTTAQRHPPERISDVYRYTALDLLPNWLATLTDDDRRDALRHLEALRRIARRDARGWESILRHCAIGRYECDREALARNTYTLLTDTLRLTRRRVDALRPSPSRLARLLAQRDIPL